MRITTRIALSSTLLIVLLVGVLTYDLSVVRRLADTQEELTTAEQRAETRMWNRRFDLKILEPLSLGFRSAEGIELFRDRCHVIPHAADDLKATARENWAWLEPLIAGRQYICGDRFTLADIQLYCFADFGNMVGQRLPAELPNLQAWFARVAQRPSAEASRHPAEAG